MPENKRELIEGGLLSVPEAARFLTVCRTTLYKLMDSGRVAYVKIGSRRMVPRGELVRLAADGLVARD